MTIDLKQPKYVLPLIMLPFLLFFFYVYQNNVKPQKQLAKKEDGINSSIGDVAASVKKKQLADKLEAYRSTFKQADGLTAVNPIPAEQSANPAYNTSYSKKQRKAIDSISMAMKNQYASLDVKKPKGRPSANSSDQALAAALNNLKRQQQAVSPPSKRDAAPKEKDPMEIFKQQMAYMDSIAKSNDPAVKAEKQKQEALAKKAASQPQEKPLEVTKTSVASQEFNTVMPPKQDSFIMAMIDENVTGYTGSRIRLRLLEDINVGKNVITKGTYIYALINGFSGQRVTLAIKSILYNNTLLPVKLDVYDMDGLLGLYVPSSAFRDFTKDLSGNSMQGISIDGNAQSGSQFLMSSVDKLFQSTSNAIASAIRKNKAKIKYNSYIYLIDEHAQQNAQNNH